MKFYPSLKAFNPQKMAFLDRMIEHQNRIYNRLVDSLEKKKKLENRVRSFHLGSFGKYRLNLYKFSSGQTQKQEEIMWTINEENIKPF